MNNRLIPTFALLVAGGIFFFYVMPTWSGSIATMRTTIASDNRALAAATTYETQQDQLAAAYNQIDLVALKRLTTLLPGSVDNVSLILNLNALAARSGLALSNIDVLTNTAASGGSTGNAGASSDAMSTNPVGSVDLALSAVGTYAALQSFLVGVEKSQRLLDVRDIIVKGSDTGVYTYQMKITFYWLH
jgi:hypothetical protein